MKLPAKYWNPITEEQHDSNYYLVWRGFPDWASYHGEYYGWVASDGEKLSKEMVTHFLDCEPPEGQHWS